MERTNFGMLLAKIEGSYGTDPVPTGGANLIAVARSSVNFGAKFDHLTRMVLDGTLSKVSGSNVMPEVSMSFSVELRGNRTTGGADTDISNGVSGNAIEIDCLLKSCDLTPTYTAETGSGNRDGYVTYNPIVPTDEGSSVTFYWYSGSKLHKIHAAKGTLKLSMKGGEFGKIDFEFKGVLGDICDAALPSASNWLRAVAVNAAGTGYAVNDILTVAGGTASTAATIRVTSVSDAGAITGVKVLQVGVYSVNPTTSGNSVTGGSGSSATIDLTMATNTAGVFLDTKPPVFTNSGSTVDSYSPVFQSIEFDLGNSVVRRDDANAATGVKGFLITGRDSKLTIDPESVAETTHPIWNDLSESKARTITAKIGTQVGNKFQGTFQAVSEGVTYGDRSNIRTQSINYSIERAALSTSAGGEIALKFY